MLTGKNTQGKNALGLPVEEQVIHFLTETKILLPQTLKRCYLEKNEEWACQVSLRTAWLEVLSIFFPQKCNMCVIP